MNRPHILGIVTGGLVLMSVSSGCSRSTPAAVEHTGKESDPQAAKVKVVHPEKRDVRRVIERPGYNIEAFERTPLYAKIAGYVQSWNVDLGDRVHKGDVLAELSVPELDAEFKQKDAAVRQAVSEIEQAKAAVQRAQAELARAKSQYDRLARVGRSGVLDNEQVDETRLGYEAGQATLAKAHADVEVAKARLEVSTADRDRARAMLSYTKIRAPFDGVVTQRSINTGDFVQPAAEAKGASLFVVEKVDPVRVFVNIQETEAVWLHDGDTAVVRVQSLQGQQFKGTVTRTSKSLNPQNRTLHVEIDLPNADGKLLPGMFANAKIVAEHKGVIALPTAAVVTQAEQSFCFCVEDGKAIRTPIQIGLRGDEMVEVMKKHVKSANTGNGDEWEDLNGDELIVASDTAALTDGQDVNVDRSSTLKTDRKPKTPQAVTKN